MNENDLERLLKKAIFSENGPDPSEEEIEACLRSDHEDIPETIARVKKRFVEKMFLERVYAENGEYEMTDTSGARKAMQSNTATWEDLNPQWIEEGDLTDYFAKSQFDSCPSCGKFENIRVVNSSGDDQMASVLCCGWQCNGDCPSEAIENWNTRSR